MSRQAETACEPAAFERRYQLDPDPWNFAHSAYEQERYALMLRTLGRTRYGTAYEPGCSIGEFTASLAMRCQRVIASDVSASAVAAARRRCAAFAHVDITVGALPDQMPRGPFDLIVFSELGYYFPAPQLQQIGASLYERLLPGGELMAVNWLGQSADHVLHGNDVARILRECLSPHQAAQQMTERMEKGFRIDVWRRS
jgi:protein-L-isoaspartate O-methyltransferase